MQALSNASSSLTRCKVNLDYSHESVLSAMVALVVCVASADTIWTVETGYRAVSIRSFASE